MLKQTFAALCGLWLALPVPALEIDVYNPGEDSTFPVSSVLVTGDREALLIDAQFQRNDAENLVGMIRASGKTLTTIYISHQDPDYYFGLDVLHAAFPDARILATPQTVAGIQASAEGKLAYWGPVLGELAPRELIVPEPLGDDHLLLEGERLEVRGLDGPAPERTYVWIPSQRTIAGGVLVFGNMHVWLADTQSRASRRHWRAALQDMRALSPVTVVPGHFLPGAPLTEASVAFTEAYLETVEEALPKARSAADLIEAVQARYTALRGADTLALSAKVLTGEMDWP
ncbi:beta-lactamase [Alcanivorax sp. S71-1-4]|uniref:MBL fold metallo-hydrolase n=1 Tax=Alcanivorax sp. S71-1-4 TaxID=1177159 RepID=UPI001358C460|nr:MBL fold metallo-hydrolase [Alcanivorax sp. S71-1-4]KAF0805627.1 beta-lactamase [Alcanivorax sp. S71-1-4]